MTTKKPASKGKQPRASGGSRTAVAPARTPSKASGKASSPKSLENPKRKAPKNKNTAGKGHHARNARRPFHIPADGVFVSKKGVEFEEDFFVPPEKGKSYGRCGGRPIRSQLEQRVCEGISRLGVAHSHSPRRFEVGLGEGKVAAYAPSIVLRGRGREGKTAIIEILPAWDDTHIRKIQAFRAMYQSEFFIILVAPGAIMDELPTETFDDDVLPSEIEDLVARLAE